MTITPFKISIEPAEIEWIAEEMENANVATITLQVIDALQAALKNIEGASKRTPRERDYY